MPNTKSAIRRVRRVKKQTQVNRVRKGKPFLLFDNGTNNYFKPISEKDLSLFIIEKIGSKCRNHAPAREPPESAEGRSSGNGEGECFAPCNFLF